MLSAFGIEHGDISKAVPVRRYELGKDIHGKKAMKLFKHTKTVHAARATGKQRYDMAVHDDDGSFFRKPKRIISSQPAWYGKPYEEGIKYTVYGGGYKKGRIAATAAGGAAATAGAGAVYHRKKVAKSYVPGVGYGRAVDLSGRGRKMLDDSLFVRRMYRQKPFFDHPPNKGASAAASREWRKEKMPSRAAGKEIVVNASARTPRHVAAEAQRSGSVVTAHALGNGRGGGKIDLYPHGRNLETLTHELAHVTPKRNPWRKRERLTDELRLGREEGRADYLAHGKPTPGAYPGSTKFKRGYNEVQRKMKAAGTKQSYQ